MAALAQAKRKTLRNKADRLFSLVVRHRDGRCQRCGSTENLQCAHVWGRRYYSTRWDEENAVALCAGCHVYFTNFPAHWHEWIIGRLGAEAYEELRWRAIAKAQTDYHILIRNLEVRLEEVAA